MADQQFCLRWNNHQNTIISVFDTLLESETLVDCTLAAEGQFLRAHKVVLSACSPFFSDLLREHYEKHPILIMKDVKFSQLKAMVDYMYRGEVNISQDELGTFLKAAESLQIKGLSDSSQNCDYASKSRTSPPSTRSRSGLKLSENPAMPRSKSVSPTPRKRKRRVLSESRDDVTEDSASEPVVEPNMSVPVQTNVNSVPLKTSPHSEEENSLPEPPGPSSNRLSSTVSISFRSGSPSHQPPGVDSSLSVQPNSEFGKVDHVEDMTTLEDDNEEAGTSQNSTDPTGFTWHVDRPEETFLSSQESQTNYRNAQGTPLKNAKQQLAAALEDLSLVLCSPMPLAENSSPLLTSLAQQISNANQVLKNPNFRSPLARQCPNQTAPRRCMPIHPGFGLYLNTTNLNNCGGRWRRPPKKGVLKPTAQLTNKYVRPAPKSKRASSDDQAPLKMLSTTCRKPRPQLRGRPRNWQKGASLQIELHDENKMWLEPSVQLVDCVKHGPKKEEDEMGTVQDRSFGQLVAVI